MAQPQATASPASFRVRVISALVLAPLALLAVWIGDWLLGLFTAVAGGLMSLEWSRLTAAGRPVLGPPLLMASMIAALLAAALGAWGWSLGVTAAAAAALILAGGADRAFAWLGAGVLYVVLPCLALLWLRARPEEGLATVIWVLALVWGVDTGAYFAGRAIGGPKLAPRISPNKTWAGLVGGMIAALLVGLAAAAFAGAKLAPVALISAGLAIVEQAGDLMESAIKRHFRVKDAGTLIPGHGGLMDRVDGLTATLLAVAALTLASGRSPLSWP